MPDIKEFFNEEMDYLTRAGQEFSKLYPERASYLNLAGLADRDPYVERLFEGFAFLTSRVREKIEDDFPEFTENLLDFVAPEFLRPIPPLTMVQFTPRPGMLQKSYNLKKGSRILSNPAGPKAMPCTFVTSKNVPVFPMHISQVDFKRDESKGYVCDISFKTDLGAKLNQLEDGHFTLWVRGERSWAWQIHHLFTNQSSQVALEVNGQLLENNSETPKAYLNGEFIKESLWPYSHSTMKSANTLFEFISFEEKFRYIHFQNLPLSNIPDDTREFKLKIYLNNPLPKGQPLETQNLVLFSTPAINLFEKQSEPISANLKSFEYPIVPDLNEDLEIYSLKTVTSIDKNSGKESKLEPFHNYKPNSAAKGFYSMRRLQKIPGHSTCYIKVGPGGNFHKTESSYLSLVVYATHGGLPRKELREGDVCNPTSDIPDFISFSNLTRPTASHMPPKESMYLWYALNHLNLNFYALSDGDTFKKVLEMYNWVNNAWIKRAINALRSVKAEGKSFMVKGQFARGTQLTLNFEDGAFHNVADQNIFGSLLHQFVSRYASINSLVSLRFKFEPSGQIVSWNAMEGLCQAL